MKRIACSTLALALVFTGCKKSEDKKPEPKPEVKPETKPETEPDTEPTAADNTLVEPDDLSYQPVDPKYPDGPQMAVVHGDPTAGGLSAFFLKLPAGSDAGIHSHTAGYQAVVVSGTPKHWLPGDKDVKPLEPGGYWMQPGDQPHGDVCEGDSECVLFLVMDGKFDFTPRPDVKEIEDRGSYKQVSLAEAKLAPMKPDGKGPKIAVLSGDPKAGPVAFYIELAANSETGMHKHTSDLHMLMLQGSTTHQVDGGDRSDKELATGTYRFQPGGQFHNDGCRGDQPCRAFVFASGAMDIVPKAPK